MFRLFSLIFMFVLINQGVFCAFQCNFQVVKDKFNQYYTCSISSNITEQHLPGTDDKEVTKVSYESPLPYMSESDFPFCQRFPNLNKIRISGVKSIDGNLLQHCRNLIEIEIVSTSIEELPENFFANNTELSILDLRKNKLKSLPEKIFAKTKDLWVILLDNNEIVSLPPKIFKSLKALDKLSLKNNKIQLLSSTLFEDLEQLDELFLNNNKISELPQNIFKNLRNLETLRMSNNQITTIHADSFGNNGGLELIDLKSNQINSIDKKIFDVLGIVTIILKGNVCIDGFLSRHNKESNKCYENYRPR